MKDPNIKGISVEEMLPGLAFPAPLKAVCEFRTEDNRLQVQLLAVLPMRNGHIIYGQALNLSPEANFVVIARYFSGTGGGHGVISENSLRGMTCFEATQELGRILLEPE